MDAEFLKSNKISGAVSVTAGAAGATDINGSTLDMAGFDAVTMLAQFGAIVSGAATSIKAQHGDASDASDMADVEGTSQTVADTDDEKLFVINIIRPQKRYVRLVVKRATQNATVIGTYIQYAAKELPVPSQGSVVGGTPESFVFPASGTA